MPGIHQPERDPFDSFSQIIYDLAVVSCEPHLAAGVPRSQLNNRDLPIERRFGTSLT